MKTSTLCFAISAIVTLAALGAGLRPTVAEAQPTVPGQSEYENQCAGCHQPGGEGTPGFSPKLAGSPIMTGEPKAVIALVLNGKGIAMPPVSPDTSDAVLAEILTYSRNSWGNKASAITAADVAAVRAEK